MTTITTIILLSLICCVVYNVFKGPAPVVDIVVSRYNENIEWLNNPPFTNNTTHVLLYEKGPNISNIPHAQSIHLPNVGRCDHTFLYHIINNYDSLPDVTVFLPGSALMDHKINNTQKVLDAVTQYIDTHDINIIHRVQHDLCANTPVKHLEDFVLDKWTTSNIENKTINDESALQPSPIRPFGKWFYQNLPNIELKSKVWYFAIFVVTKEQIRKHPIELYKRLIKYVDNHSNPEVGHYLERTWANLFI